MIIQLIYYSLNIILSSSNRISKLNCNLSMMQNHCFFSTYSNENEAVFMNNNTKITRSISEQPADHKHLLIYVFMTMLLCLVSLCRVCPSWTFATTCCSSTFRTWRTWSASRRREAASERAKPWVEWWGSARWDELVSHREPQGL